MLPISLLEDRDMQTNKYNALWWNYNLIIGQNIKCNKNTDKKAWSETLGGVSSWFMSTSIGYLSNVWNLGQKK